MDDTSKSAALAQLLAYAEGDAWTVNEPYVLGQMVKGFGAAPLKWYERLWNAFAPYFHAKPIVKTEEMWFRVDG